MKIFVCAVILMLRSATQVCEATFPGILLLPFMPKLLRKVSSTHPPSLALALSQESQPQITTSIPEHHQNDFVKLHKWLEQTQQSNFVATDMDAGSQELQTYRLLEGTQPQQRFHETPDTVTSVIASNPLQHFPPSEAQTASLASNQGPPQISLNYHQQHQPVPLTFPPESSGSQGSYSLPKIISLPPLPPPSQQQQHLPQSSTHYSTSSLSYALSQGSRQNYGTPKSTKIVRHVSVFVAPPDLPYNSQNRQKIRVQGEAEKHVNIIFIKSPDSGKPNTAEIELPPSPEQKTYVYVLNKAQEGPENVVVNTPEPPKYNPPDVFFINYKGGQNQQQEGQQQYGTPLPQQQYGPPPSLQQRYGSPLPPQQGYGPPPSLQQQYGSPPPPQQRYGPPPTPHVQYKSPPPPQQQYGPSTPPQQQHYGSPTQYSNSIQSPPLEQLSKQNQSPSLEYVAPSNQNFNYNILPSPIIFSSIPILKPSNNTAKTISNCSNICITIGGLDHGVTKVSESTRRVEETERIQEDSYNYAINFNYLLSGQPNDDWESKDDNKLQAKLEQDENHPKIGQKGIFMSSPLSENISSTTHINDNGSINEPTKHNQESFQQTSPISTSSTIASVTRRTGDEVLLSPNITARSFSPSSSPSTPIPKYTPIVRESLSLSKNLSIGESIANSSSNKDDVVIGNGNGSGDIIVLTKQNLTSRDLVEDNVKKKGRPRNISGRLDNVTSYEYAPFMGHQYFGISDDQHIKQEKIS